MESQQQKILLELLKNGIWICFLEEAGHELVTTNLNGKASANGEFTVTKKINRLASRALFMRVGL